MKSWLKAPVSRPIILNNLLLQYFVQLNDQGMQTRSRSWLSACAEIPTRFAHVLEK